jgi:diacylglycerol O-acyltransferase
MLFLLNEARETPMNVGGVHLFTLPDGADEIEFLAKLGELLHDDTALSFPFGQRLRDSLIPNCPPTRWEEDPKLDMEYHVRHSALPRPGRYRELFALVSRLHSTLLDRSRPLWEFNLIEGLQNRQFATYSKVHHAAMDGAMGMHLTNSMYSSDPESRAEHSPFSVRSFKRYQHKLAELHADASDEPPTADEIKSVNNIFSETLGSAVNIGKAIGLSLEAYLKDGHLKMPFSNVPSTPFNQRISGARRFVAQSWSFDRVYTVGKALDGTLNDTVLAMSAGALRKYLKTHAELPTASLKAMAPMSIRPTADVTSSNAVAAITADLATNVADIELRYRTIHGSMRAGRDFLQQLTRREIDFYTMIMQAPAIMVGLMGVEHKVPAYSTVISNVPGPRKQMYWNGASLDGMYPASAINHGTGLNITMVSNNKSLDFGIVACRHSMPHVQRLINYLEDALVELEELADIRPQKRRASSE